MQFLIIFAFTFATAFCLPDEEIKSRNIVVPVGRPQGRITNGHNAHEGQLPYQAGIISYYAAKNTSWCGGALISNTDVITAAHCVESAAEADVILGTFNLYSIHVLHKVSADDIIIHPNYNISTFENDIAIIKIPHTNYSTYIQAADLPLAYDSVPFDTVVTSGWGDISDYVHGAVSHLQYAETVVLDNRFCAQYHNIFPSNICISGYNGVSSCKGDSGGPLALQRQNRTVLVGIHSTISLHGCEKNFPTIGTRVFSFLEWIMQNSNATFVL